MTPPELNRPRALAVLSRIEEILIWDKISQNQRDEHFIELGQYLCEVRAGQYWRLDELKSFDEFLAKRFPDSRRKAYYLMAIQESLTKVPKRQLREVGWTKAIELAKVARRERASGARHPPQQHAQQSPFGDAELHGIVSRSAGKRTLWLQARRFYWRL